MVWPRPIGYEFFGKVITLRAVRLCGTFLRLKRLNAHAMNEASEGVETPIGKDLLTRILLAHSYCTNQSASCCSVCQPGATDDIADNGAVARRKLERLDQFEKLFMAKLSTIPPTKSYAVASCAKPVLIRHSIDLASNRMRKESL